MTKVNKPLIKLLLLQIVFFIGISNVNSQIEKPYNSAIKINLTETAILNPTVSYETNLYKISNIEFDIGYYSSRENLRHELYGGGDDSYIFVGNFLNNHNIYSIFYQSVSLKITFKRFLKVQNHYFGFQLIDKYSFMNKDKFKVDNVGDGIEYYNPDGAYYYLYDNSSTCNAIGFAFMYGIIFNTKPIIELYFGGGFRIYNWKGQSTTEDHIIENTKGKNTKPIIHLGLKMGLNFDKEIKN